MIRFSRAKEQIISLRDLPRVIRATIKKHAAGAKITEIEKDTVDGTVRYEVEVVHDDKEFDIIVSVEGKYQFNLLLESDQDENDDEDKEDQPVSTYNALNKSQVRSLVLH